MRDRAHRLHEGDHESSLRASSTTTSTTGEPPLGICPTCGGNVVESVWGYRCVNNERQETPVCDFMIWKDRFGRYIDRSLADAPAARAAPSVRSTGSSTGRARDAQGHPDAPQGRREGRWVLDAKIGAAVPTGEQGRRRRRRSSARRSRVRSIPTAASSRPPAAGSASEVLDGHERVGPVLPKKVCLRELQPEEVAGYFGDDARTAMLEGFTSPSRAPVHGHARAQAHRKTRVRVPRAPGRGRAEGRNRAPRG